MSIRELQDLLNRKLLAGVISPEDEIYVRNPDVSNDAMEAGSDGYHELEEVLTPQDGRIILLGETY